MAESTKAKSTQAAGRTSTKQNEEMKAKGAQQEMKATKREAPEHKPKK